jgi:hypothetical protein
MPPEIFDERVTGDGKPRHWAERILRKIEAAMNCQQGLYTVVTLPNILHILFRLEAGYVVECIRLDQSIEDVLGMLIRRSLKSVQSPPQI